jgi:alanine racemase
LIDLRPVLTLKSRIVYVKTVPEGQEISYGGTFTTARQTRVATICLGYGDGYPRALSNTGYVLIKGHKAPIVGRVCMDQFMVDVTDIKEPILVGDVVTLIGKDGGESITMEELGDLSGRFNYELACDLGKRVPRIYKSDDTLIYD